MNLIFLKDIIVKKYFTRAEAKKAELEYLNRLKENVNVPTKMILEDLQNTFLEYQDNKVIISTKVGYKYRRKYNQLLILMEKFKKPDEKKIKRQIYDYDNFIKYSFFVSAGSNVYLCIVY